MNGKLPSDCVWIARSEEPGYGSGEKEPPRELPGDVCLTKALFLLRSLFREARLDSQGFGSPQWNPLGGLIPAGANVLVKPNWVMDENSLPRAGEDCLVTHPSVIEAVLHYVAKAGPGKITVGDAPVQDCDFENLIRKWGLSAIVQRYEKSGRSVQVRDFRLTRKKGRYGEKIQREPDPGKYCPFDLGQDSWLTPVTGGPTEFRVTNYDPDILKKHHFPGTHRYLIAREVLDADVVISLPKLKTHQKAGLTGALKNMVGINGFKEYLPHHRKGGSRAGGDCYEGGGLLKRLAEDALDRANRGKGAGKYFLNKKAAGLAVRLHSAFFGGDRNLEGSWYGNDTVWRMCLDLQRILHYGTRDGELARTPQRLVLTITDGIVAGEGDGPLAPTPVPLGILSLGANVAALDYVHCLLMGFDPFKIPLVAHSFDSSPWPLAGFSPGDIRVFVNGNAVTDPEGVGEFGRPFSPPSGWKGHCEKGYGKEVPQAG